MEYRVERNIVGIKIKLNQQLFDCEILCCTV